MNVSLFKLKPKPILNKRILFILKERHDYGDYSYSGMSSGLYNSAKFCADMLAANGYVTSVVEVLDNNGIDREVVLFKPDIVIIEALWVIPSKFSVLTKLHPKVKWIVRIHSEAAFLAQEGIAIEWISLYPNYPSVYVSMNSKEGLEQAQQVYIDKKIDLKRLLYLPTYYPAPKKPYFNPTNPKNNLSVACMGAIRPLKNNLIQAAAAMKFADSRKMTLYFHINNGRLESGGNPCYRNLIALFKNTRHKIVQHEWLNHADFVQFLSYMDLGMQVSFSETFCIIAADLVSAGVGIIGSPAIDWLDKESQASTIEIDGIVKIMKDVFKNRGLAHDNLKNLQCYADNAEQSWLIGLRS
jgi:hypothetical protein